MPRSAKHLSKHKFKKGVSGNPEGGRKHNPAMRALGKLTVEKFREVIQLVIEGKVQDLKDMAENPNTPAIQVGVAISFLKAMKNGDYPTIERMAERLVGKIPDELKIQPMTVNQKVSVIDKTALAKAMLELKDEV